MSEYEIVRQSYVCNPVDKGEQHALPFTSRIFVNIALLIENTYGDNIK